MTVERALRLIAGAFVVLSVLLGIYVNTLSVVYGVRGLEPVPVGVYQLVPDDGDPAKERVADAVIRTRRWRARVSV